MAEGAEVGGPGGYFESGQSYLGDAQVGSASAAVDDGAGSFDGYGGGLKGFDYVAGAASGGDDVFNHDGGFAGADGEPSAEDHFAGRWIAFGEQESCAQGAGDFVADDEASYGGGDYEVHFRKVRGEFAAEFFGDQRMLEDQRALHVFVRMESAGEAEVTFEVGAGFAELVEYGFGHGNKIAGRTTKCLRIQSKT